MFDKDITYKSEQQFVEIILKYVKDYEEIPRRLSMTTAKMMQWLISEAVQSDTDSSTRTIVCGIRICGYQGSSVSEWSQTSQPGSSRLDNPGSPSRAFIRPNLVSGGK